MNIQCRGFDALSNEGDARRPTVLMLMGASGRGQPVAGPMSSLQGTIALLSGEMDFKVVIDPKRFGEDAPQRDFPGWVQYGRAAYFWLRPSRRALWRLLALLSQTRYDILLLNGFFDREFTIPALFLRRLSLIPRRPTILAPRGEFSPGALALKGARKRAYLAVARRLGLLDGITFQASGEREADDIRRALPWVEHIAVASDIRVLRPLPPHTPSPDGRPRLVFLSRIDRKKNLDCALAALGELRTPVSFDIIGPVSNADYWRACQSMIARLPAHIAVRYLGTIPNAEVLTALAGYDLFVLPTRGGNFGHAILDALEAGTPVLISDETPWRELERHEAGWDLPLADPGAFTAAIERFASMGPDERLRLRRGARRFAEKRAAEDDAVARNRELFLSVLGANQTSPMVESRRAEGSSHWRIHNVIPSCWKHASSMKAGIQDTSQSRAAACLDPALQRDDVERMATNKNNA